MKLGDRDYGRLLALRTGLRRFLRWSETQAQAAGITPAQHQLLLAVRGHGDPRGPTVGEAADYLLLRHHSVVELAQRTEAAGLIERVPDRDDRRVVRLTLTAEGRAALQRVSALNLEELARLAGSLRPLWEGLTGSEEPESGPPVVADLRSIALAAEERGVAWTLEDPSELNVNVVHLPRRQGIDSHAADVDVIITVLAGRGSLVVDGEPIELRAGVLAHVGHGRSRRVEAGSDGLSYLTVHRRRAGIAVTEPPASDARAHR